jgi:hypothetical protein
MEHLDSDDPLKNQLIRKSAQHREQLEEDVKMISERTEKMITNALVIGAALAATYFLVSRFSGSKKKKKSKVKKIKLVKEAAEEPEEVVVQSEEPAAPGVITQIGAALASQATALLLNLAKEKLDEFLQAQSEKKENLNGNSQ